MQFETLYRKDSNGKIAYWEVEVNVPSTGELKESITVKHGKLGGKELIERIPCNRAANNEAVSRFNAKLKQGYKTVQDVKDNTNLPVEGSLEHYLSLYLPDDRTTADGSLLPMLAKVYDNENNKVFKNQECYIGQWKINGLRCFIRAEKSNDIFQPIKFTFQSREGTYWNTLNTLSECLYFHLPATIIDGMLEEGWILDGELYIPGFSINQINHIVKDATSPYNKFVQFWMYDMYVPDMTQIYRSGLVNKNLFQYIIKGINHIDDHLNIKSLLNVLPNYEVYNDSLAVEYRDTFIKLGFEGLILRNPNLEYAAGKRRMIKYKDSTDGVFQIIDIIPEGIKRPDIAKFVCRNDINDATFECTPSVSLEYKKEILKNKHSYIGKNVSLSYSERSGINNLPFHIKNVRILNK